MTLTSADPRHVVRGVPVRYQQHVHRVEPNTCGRRDVVSRRDEAATGPSKPPAEG